MSAETPFGEDAGEIKAMSTVTDLDFGIEELSVSPLPYGFTWGSADESSATMGTSDVLAADGLLSAFDSVSFAERPELRNDRAKNTIQSDEGQYISAFDFSDFAKVVEPSLNEVGEAEVDDEIDEQPKSNDHLIVYKCSRMNSACDTNTKITQNNDSQKPLTNFRTSAQQDSESDLKSLQISRRRRSLFPKRARSFAWGSVGLPAFEEHNLDSGDVKRTGRKKVGHGKRNAIKNQRGKKSEKNCTPTRRISLKIKIGNKSCGVVNFTENINASRKNFPGLCDIMDSNFEEKLLGDVVLPNESNLEKGIASEASVLGTHLNDTNNVENRSFSTVTDLHQITSHEEGGNLRASTGNRSSDPGTSPDSEVINSVPDAPLYENGTSFTLRKVQVGGEENPPSEFADGSESTNPQGCTSLIPCSNVRKSPKCCSAKEGSKSRSGVLNKKGKSSKKKGESNLIINHQIEEKGEINGLFSGVESHLEAGTF